MADEDVLLDLKLSFEVQLHVDPKFRGILCEVFQNEDRE
jgi:hypothetical protein